MGSLMAGWACDIPDPQVVKYKRNKSLTKEEIEAFWRSRKQKEEEHLRNSSVLSHIQDLEESAKTSNLGEILGMKSDCEEKLIKKHGWWVSSSLAHLNEPPVLGSEEATYKHLKCFKLDN